MSTRIDEYLETYEEELELCEHGYPEGHGCEECAYWERVDFEYDYYMDR